MFQLNRHSASALACLVVFSLGLSAEAIDRKTVARARSLTDKGQKALESQSYDAAVKSFEKAIITERTLPQAYVGLAAAQLGLGEVETALKTLDLAAQRYIDWDNAMEKHQLEAKQDVASRARDMRTIDAKSATGPATDNKRTWAQDQRGQIENDEHMSTRQDGPREAEFPAQIDYLRGVAQLRLNHRTEAMLAFDACLAKEPAHALANYNLGVALFQEGELLEAEERLNLAQENGIQLPEALVADLTRALEAERKMRPKS